MKNLTFTINFLIICFLTFSDNLYAHPTPPYDKEQPVSFEMFLPENMAVEDVASFELVEAGEVSNIYRIRTKDGKTYYEVLSMVTLQLLPQIAKAACTVTCYGLVANPSICNLCNYVSLAGSAIIMLNKKGFTQKTENFWRAAIKGSKGFGQLFTRTLSSAREGQTAFKVSRQKTGYPWQSPEVIHYPDDSGYFGGNK